MRFESRADEVVIRPVPRALELAADDVVGLAQARAPKRTGRFARSIARTDAVQEGPDRVTVGVGSPLSSARIKERGGTIRARRGRYLTFPLPGGGFVKVESVRLPARPTVIPAARQFGRFFAARLRR